MTHAAGWELTAHTSCNIDDPYAWFACLYKGSVHHAPSCICQGASEHYQVSLSHQAMQILEDTFLFKFSLQGGVWCIGPPGTPSYAHKFHVKRLQPARIVAINGKHMQLPLSEIFASGMLSLLTSPASQAHARRCNLRRMKHECRIKLHAQACMHAGNSLL